MRTRSHRPAISASIVIAFVLVSLVQAKGQKIVFYFVAPDNIMTANFGAGIDSKRCPSGYSKVEITTANVAKFNSLAPYHLKYVYGQLKEGTALRNNISLVAKNSSGIVPTIEYWLADDQTGITTEGRFSSFKDNGKMYVWPSASYVTDPVDSKKFVGSVGLGEYQMATDQSKRTGELNAVDELVLHETSHTQWTGGFSRWGSINGKNYTYGADNMHYFLSCAEMLGDQEAALDEGLATSYGFLMNKRGLERLMTEYTSVDYRYFVEGQSVLAGSADLYKVKNRKSTTLSDGNGHSQNYPTGGPIVVYSYKWWDVPGWYLLFAECTSTAYFSLFRNETYQDKDLALGMIGAVAAAMSSIRTKRFLTYACNQLGLRMEDYNNSSAGKADASRISALFPFALLDLLTHFGMTDAEFREDYQKNNAEKDPKAYNEYFTRRAAIRSLVQADITSSPIKFPEAVEKIKAYCRQPANMF
jgi:hypothetical protein